MSRRSLPPAERSRRREAAPRSLFSGGAAHALILLLVVALGAAAACAAPAAASEIAEGAPPEGSGSFTPAPTSSALPMPDPSATYAAGTGGRVYADNCSGCHGPRGEGLVGPTLAAAGFASLVAPMVTQGGIDMPPFEGVLSDADVEAVAGFVAADLADAEAREAQVGRGGDLYRLYCSGCHGSTGRGGSLPEGPNPPDISRYPAAQALAAMIFGRGEMPAFAGNTFDVREQTSVALYVDVLVTPPSPGGAGLGFLGPVPEGAVGGVILLILILIPVWLAWRSREAPQ